MQSLATLLNGSPLLPIIQTEQVQDAVAIAKAMQQGGVVAVEVVLRNASAMQAISAIREQVPELLVGAGTILSKAQALDAKAAGAQFLVSPASPRELLEAMIATDLPLAPGVSTATEMAAAVAMGLTELKFFPAHLSGGPAMLQAVRSIYPQVRFCPTGGVSLSNLADYIRLPNVFVVGGSWLTPASNGLALTSDAYLSQVRDITRASLEKAASVTQPLQQSA